MAVSKNSLSILSGYLIVLLIELFTQKILWTINSLYIVLTLESLLGSVLLLWLNHHFSYQNPIEKKASSNLKNIILWGILGIGLIFMGQVLTLTITHFIFKQSLFSQNTAQFLTIFKHAPYYGLDIVIATPIIEELIFRKILFGNLTLWFKPWIAALISSFLFVIIHQDGHFLTYFVMGCILEFIYYKAHDIRAAMITHAGLNLLVLLIFGLK